jgi:hypothetical protein
MRSILSAFLAIWILAGSFMPQNDMEELCKIPALINHYHEHRNAAIDQSLSFTSFLAQHYGNMDKEEKGHEDLPFFKHLIPSLLFLIPQTGIKLDSIAFTVFLPSEFPELNFSLATFSGSHWQPPRC